MANDPRASQGHGVGGDIDTRYVYVLPGELAAHSLAHEAKLEELLSFFWSRKWTALAITMIFFAMSLGYVLIAPKWYRAEVLLAPSDTIANQHATSEQLGGGLSAILGNSVESEKRAEALAVLESREFLGAFIKDENLMRILFPEAKEASDGSSLGDNSTHLGDVRDGVEFFRNRLLEIEEDRASGLVAVRLEWTNARLAADWLTVLIYRLNQRLRERASETAQANLAYLRSELDKTNVVPLQQAIGRLLEREMRNLMLARATVEFAFRVVDPASVAKKHVRPRFALVVGLGTVLGIGVASLVLLVLFSRRR